MGSQWGLNGVSVGSQGYSNGKDEFYRTSTDCITTTAIKSLYTGNAGGIL